MLPLINGTNCTPSPQVMSWPHSRSWNGKAFSQTTTSIHQPKPKMASTPTSSETSLPEMQRALRTLEEHASHLIQNEPEKHHLSLMRSKAGELNCDLDVKDADLQRFLDDAEGFANKGQIYYGGQKLQATESVFLLDGLVKLGEANVIVGQPKVGKSSFSTGLIASLRDRRETFLGRELSLPEKRMPVLIFGTDQSEGDWLHFLRREALVNESQELDGNALDFFCSLESTSEYNFTKDGLKRMRVEVDKHQCPLVIIDSLSSMMEPTGIEENTSRYAQPIRTAIKQLRTTGATLLIIHHSVKRPTTWDWITECRGSSSISSVFSWGFLMRWVAQEDDGLARTDKRVGFTGKGRGNGDTGGVMAEYLAEGGWTYLDGLEAAQQVERVKGRIAELGGVRANVFDYLYMRSELGADVPTEELAIELNKSRSHVGRELQCLRSKGLSYVHRFEETGSRPRPYWRVTTPVMEAMCPGGLSYGSNGSFANKSNKTILFNSQEPDKTKRSNPLEDSNYPMPVGCQVDICRGDSWQNGWIVHEITGPTLIASKIGSPMTQIKNLRPDFDVRPSVNPFGVSSTESTTNPSSQAGGAGVLREHSPLSTEREMVDALSESHSEPDYDF